MGCFFPINIVFYNKKMGNFRGDLTDTSAETTTMNTSITSRSSLLLLLASVCWGLGTVISKQLLQAAPPITLFATQLGTSVVFLWSIVGLRGLFYKIRPVPQTGWQPPMQPRWQPRGHTLRDKLRRAALGILEPGLTYALGTIGLSLTTASNTALIAVTEPLAVIILAAIILREKITFTRLFFVLMGCAGAVLVAGNSWFALGAGLATSFNPTEVLGNLLVFVGLCAAALCVVLTQRSISCAEPLTLTAGQQTASLVYVVLPLLVFALFSTEAALWKRGASNAGYHYLGCAKTFALMGHAFAEATLTMMKDQGRQ